MLLYKPLKSQVPENLPKVSLEFWPVTHPSALKWHAQGRVIGGNGQVALFWSEGPAPEELYVLVHCLHAVRLRRPVHISPVRLGNFRMLPVGHPLLQGGC